ncbi:hypothetical protein OH76DRAFT_973576 [Lentinus brumalis]|uniref:Hydrophobin n=1 Tax=Lentinus brumalis TaxID=2498619 RepID=A0A371DPP2_9APHY|nr:hypothetical protein OH76DRAFT_973576 [Polyporus brumalis]
MAACRRRPRLAKPMNCTIGLLLARATWPAAILGEVSCLYTYGGRCATTRSAQRVRMSGQAAEREQQLLTSGTSILRHGRRATYLMLKACGNEIGRMCRNVIATIVEDMHCGATGQCCASDALKCRCCSLGSSDTGSRTLEVVAVVVATFCDRYDRGAPTQDLKSPQDLGD